MVERPPQNGQKDRAHRGEPKKATASPTCSFAGVFARKSINVIFSPSFRHSVRPAAVDRPSAASQPPVFITLVVLFPAAVHAVARLHGTGFVPRGLARSFPLSSLPKLHVQFHLQDGTPTRKVLASFVATCESEKSVNNPTEG